MNSPIEILSGIWIGSVEYALNKNFYINNNIDIVINCTNDTEFIELNTLKHKIKIPFGRDFPSKYNLHVINDYVEKILEIIHKSMDNYNILIYSYKMEIIPLSIISLFIVKYGGINEESIESIIKSKININTYPSEISIDLSLFKHMIE
tara:strand:- start:234 stop:680 length:447 start_codon:yes stop_codon:yes gene_type:complete